MKHPMVDHRESELECSGNQYQDEGFDLGPVLLPPELVQRANRAMDAVMMGEYETGVAPLDSWWSYGDDPSKKLRKIDQPHLANRTIHELVCHPALGRWVAQVTGARFVQVWCVQLLHKPSGGDATGAVGWHQDYQYWQKWWTPDSDVFTVWVAVTDVRENCGPMFFVRGSHHWGLLDSGDFFGAADDAQRCRIQPPSGQTWQEFAAVMPAGAASMHHRLTFHGSRPNHSGRPRRSFAIHLRGDHATATPGHGVNPTDRDNYDYVSFLDDPSVCPIIYQA